MQVALTIAGSDSGGGAGVQGDLLTFARFGVFGTAAITAVTAQNTVGVRAWEAVSARLVRAQIEAVFDDLRPAAVKTGMLGTADVVRAVFDSLRERDPVPLVIDPVMTATSGDRLATDEAATATRELLLSIASLVTPNLDEAGALLGRDIQSESEAEMCAAARDIVDRFGARAALVKGGHAHGDEIADVLYDGQWHVFRHRRIDSTSTHGTGCALSAAITAQLALGAGLKESVECAIDYVARAIVAAPGLGSGNGPLLHSAY